MTLWPRRYLVLRWTRLQAGPVILGAYRLRSSAEREARWLRKLERNRFSDPDLGYQPRFTYTVAHREDIADVCTSAPVPVRPADGAGAVPPAAATAPRPHVPAPRRPSHHNSVRPNAPQ